MDGGCDVCCSTKQSKQEKSVCDVGQPGSWRARRAAHRIVSFRKKQKKTENSIYVFVGGSTQQMAGKVWLWLVDHIEYDDFIDNGIETWLGNGNVTSCKLSGLDFSSLSLSTVCFRGYLQREIFSEYGSSSLLLWYTNKKTQQKYAIMLKLLEMYEALFQKVNPVDFGSLRKYENLKLLSEAFFNGNPMSFEHKNRRVMIHVAPQTINDTLDNLLESTDPFDCEKILVEMRPLCSNYVTEEIRKLRERMRPLPRPPSTLTTTKSGFDLYSTDAVERSLMRQEASTREPPGGTRQTEARVLLSEIASLVQGLTTDVCVYKGK